uniref:Reverse transcriptase domain-containing protein n=1 Tax=Tanacetum cinerariifolium TaxID=118510 RepID=A0A699HHG9_TANCI|nr:reverse transcriptase domain-containing protein [Tanacetum cinerariifolium]
MRQKRWMELFSNYECEICYHLGKVNVVADALSRKERVKPRRVREMAMTIHSGVRGMILAAQSEKGYMVSLVGGVRTLIMDEAHKTNWDVHLPLAEFSYNNGYHSSIRCAPFEALYERKCRSPVLCVEIKESSLIRPELVQETTNKAVLIKEKLKTAMDHQKSFTDNRHKPLEFEVGDRVLLKEPIEIMDHEVRNLKRSKISLLKVCWNSKRGPEFTWEREDHMKSKYPHLFVDRVVELAS